MLSRKLSWSILLFLSALAAILSTVIFSAKNDGMEIVFFDVGQGDAILISQGSNQILIDGGKDGKRLLEKMGKFVPFWDRNIEVVMATHPDHDHIGGLIDVLKTYGAYGFLKTNAKSDSATYKKLEEEIGRSGAKKIEAVEKVKMIFPNGGELEILHPSGSVDEGDTKSSNENSIVAKLKFGGNSFLLTGDITGEREKELVASGKDLAAEVLKVSHHGSKYSTTDEFLSATGAKSAVISVGKSNSYGHPSNEILRKLSGRGATIYRTDELGDVFFRCESSREKCVVANQGFL